MNKERKRVVFSVRINKGLEKEFTDTVKEKDLSTCFIVEALLRGWLEGFKVSPASMVYPNQKIQPIVINQKFERVVKRGERRKYREFVMEPNCYDAENNLWKYDDVELGDLRANGHSPSCRCSECRSL